MTQINDNRPESRPNNREVENENLRPVGDGKPPQPATGTPGPARSKDKIATDPGSGRAR